MLRSVPFVVASLACAITLSSQLGRAEASLPASKVVLQHNDTQMRSEELFVREPNVNAPGRRFRASLALVSLAAAALALAFVVFRCFRGLESQHTFNASKVVARRLADEEEGAAGGADCGPSVGFYGGVPISMDENGTPLQVLVEVKGNQPYLNHPQRAEPVPLVVLEVPDVGLMLHEAGTNTDLEWILFHPHEPHPSIIPPKHEGEEEEEAEKEEGSSSSESDDEDEDKPRAARIVSKPTMKEWTHQENPQFPFMETISGMPFLVDQETGELTECLLTVQRGQIVFKNPLFDQFMKLELVGGDLLTSEGLGLRDLVEEIRKAGPPAE